jgi:hypothetical protein
MFRILLPLAVAASLIFAPLYKVELKDDFAGDVSKSLTAADIYIGDPVSCARNLKFNPMDEECAPKQVVNGEAKSTLQAWAMYAAAAGSAGAGILGILGLLPFIGRLTSMVTTAAGGVSIAAIGTFIFNLWQSGGLDALQWGGWLAGGLSLLTVISGLRGIGGND